jgi:hypothetical protein
MPLVGTLMKRGRDRYLPARDYYLARRRLSRDQAASWCQA